MAQAAAWRREQLTGKMVDGKWVHNAAYKSCMNVYHSDKSCRAAFPDGLDTFFRHCLELWAEQGLLCAHSGILLQGRDCEHSFLQMSLDAIDPRLGHVPGNLRWVCMGLNSTNMDKNKKHDDDGDPESAWTRESWAAYVGIDLSEIRTRPPFVLK